MHLLEHAHDPATRPPGDDLVAERGARGRLRDPHDERGAQLPGEPAQQRRLRRARERPVERHHVLRPEHQLRRRAEGRDAEARRELRRVDRGGRDLLLAQPTLPTTLDQRHPHGAHRAPAIGGDGAGDRQRDDPRDADHSAHHRGTSDVVEAGPDPCCERGDGDTAGPEAGGDQERTAQARQLDEGAVRLAEEHPAQGESAEGPGHAQRLGQRAGAHEGERTTAQGWRQRSGGREEERLEDDQHQRAVPVEGAGPGQPDAVAAQPGQPPRPHPRPQREPTEAPVEQRGSEQAERPPPPGWERQRQEHTGHDRGGGDAAPARQSDHKSACAAARPLAMQAGMPTPW